MWTGCLYLRHEGVMRAVYVVDHNVWGVPACLAGDPGGQGGCQLAGYCTLCYVVGDGNGKARSGGDQASFSSLSLGQLLYLCGNQGGWKGGAEGSEVEGFFVVPPQFAIR